MERRRINPNLLAAKAEKAKQAAWKRVNRLIDKLARSPDLDLIWDEGDGEGGAVRNAIDNALARGGLYDAKNEKKVVSGKP